MMSKIINTITEEILNALESFFQYEYEDLLEPESYPNLDEGSLD
jgi:hypothetical protein